MNFTKQDFEKILAYINRRSAKDSSFPVLSEVGDGIDVPVLSNGSNRLLPLERLIDYLSRHIDVARIPVDVSGLEGSTLLDVLNELYVIAKTEIVIDPETGEGLVLPSKDITYTKSGFNFNDVKTALDTLFDLMSSKADDDDVTSAIGNISTALANKADLETTSRKVLYNQMPSVILRYIAKSTTDTEASHTLSEGDVYYGSTGYLLLYTNSATHSLGTPNKGLIYYCIEDGKYYKYDSRFSWTEIGVSGSDDGQGSASPDLSTILGGDGKIKSALTPACVMYITNAVPSITDVPVHSYYCLLSTRPQDVNIYYRDEVVTEYITQFNDILIGQPQANVIYYDIVTDKLYRWQSSKFVNLTHNASLGDDGRVVPEQATAVVLKYIASVNNTNIPQLNTGDVYCDQSNILWVKGSSYGPDIAPISHTSENGIIEVGSPDSHLIYYNIHTNGFYKWSGSAWDMIGSSGDGTITSIMMNGSVVREYEGTVDLGTVVTDISGKTDKASDSRLQSSQATAVILKYINGKITDDEGNESTEGSIDNPPLVGDGDVFFSGNHISARVAGNSVNLGLPDSSIIYYNLYTKKFYRWKGTDYGWGEVGVTVDSSDFALKNDLMITTNGDKTTITLGQGKTVQVINQHQSLSSYATKNYVDQAVQQSAGQDGKSAYQVAVDNGFRGSEAEWLASLHGADGVTNGDDVVVVHDYNGEPSNLEQGQVAVLGADLGTAIGKVFNVNTADTNNATPYRLWVGTAEQLEALEANDGIEDDVIYLIGTVPTPAVRYNVSKNLTNCTVPTSTPATVKEGAVFSVTVSPASGYTIDTATGTMDGGGTLTKTSNQDGSVTFSTQSVTGNITITASASVHLQSITVTQGTRAGNAIQMNAVLNPANAENVSLQWSISEDGTNFSSTTSHFEISGSGNTATLVVKDGADNTGVWIKCADTNSASGTANSNVLQLSLSYDDTVPLESLGAVSYTVGAAANTYQFSVAKNPVGANTHSIKWDIDSVSPRGAATIDADTGLLTITNDCEVVVSAKAYQGMAQDTNINTATSDIVTLTYQLSGPIQFEDWKAKGLALYMVNKIAATATKEEIEADTQIKYENVAGLTRPPGREVPATYITGERSIEYFNEAEYFKSWYLNPSNWPKLREFAYDGDNENFKDISTSGEQCINNPKLVKLKLPNNLSSLNGDASGGPINTLAAIQVLDLSNTQLVNLTTGQRLFNSCSKLKTIIMPPTLQNFTTEQVARNVTTLQYVVFTGKDMVDLSFAPYTVSSINLVFTSTVVPVGITAIPAKTDLIYVPDAKFDLYKAKSPFSTKYSSGKLKKISELPANWNKTVYSVTTSNATNSNDTSVVEYKSSYQATLSSDGSSGSLTNVKVVMDGEDVTSTVYDMSTHTISITKVLGDIVIDGNYVEPETTE